MLVIETETLKSKISDFLNSNICFYLPLCGRFCHPHLVYITLINRSCKWPINGLVDSLQGYCCQTQMLVVGVGRWIKFVNMARFIGARNFIKHSLKVQATITGSRLFDIFKEAKNQLLFMLCIIYTLLCGLPIDSIGKNFGFFPYALAMKSKTFAF